MPVKGGRAALVYVLGGLAGALTLLGIVLMWSPGRPRPFLDHSGRPVPGSLSEKIRVDINGVDQGMFVKSAGTSAGNPRHPGVSLSTSAVPCS